MIRSRCFSSFLSLLALAALLLPFGRIVRAQVGQGEITGLVTDPSGASVPNAKVTLTSSATSEYRGTQTTSAGLYRFVAVPVVGTYAIKVEASGFKIAEVAGIVVSTGTVITQDIHLEIGTATQTVTVEAGVAHVDTTDSSVSTLVDRRLWQSLPLENRTQNTFINILPGVVPNQFGGTTRGAAVNGVRPGMSNYLLDGYDNNDQGQGGRGVGGAEGAAGAVTQLSPDAIQEYRVITNDFPAEYGKGGAFVNDTVLKSGSNDWHGSAFEYNRVQAFAANDFFSNKSGIKDRLVRNQFGGSAGGPILKNKTFFYATYERHTRRQASPITSTGTTQDFINFVKTGAFETFMETSPAGFCNVNLGHSCPGAFSGSATLGPLFTKLLAKGPFPLATNPITDPTKARGAFTSPGLRVGFKQIFYPVNVYGTVAVSDPFLLNQNKGSIKVDHRLSSKAQLSGTYAITDSFTQDTFGGSDANIGPAFLNPARSQDLGLTLTYTFTPVLINQFRASYLRRLSNFPDAAGFQGIPSVPTFFDPLGVAFGVTSNLPQFFTDNQFQYHDSITYVHGKHTFKAGGEYRRTRNGSSFQAIRNSLIEPWDVENLLTDGFFGDQADLTKAGPALGGIAFAEASINPITNKFPEYYRGYRANEIAWYFQDDFRVAPRFTINAGLRWEYFGPPHNFRPGIDSNFYFGNNVVPISGTTITNPTANPFFPSNSTFAAGVRTGTFQVRNHNIWGKDLNNFGPRLGFAWDVFGTQKVVLRGGYGIFYDRLYNNVFENIRFNPPFFAFSSLGSVANGVLVGPLATPGLYQVPFTSPAAFGGFGGKPSPRQIDDNLVNAYIQQFHLGTEWELAHNLVLSVNGIGTIGNKLIGLIDGNTFDGRTACTSAASPRAACKAAFAAGQIPAVSFSQDRVNTSLVGDNLRTNAFRSNYYGLQIEGRKVFSNGLQFNANYTYSHAIDEFSDIFNNGRGNVAHPTDNFNIKLDRGNADFDIRHRFVASYYYELPIFKSNRWLGGWSWSGITTVQKGVPIQLIATADLNRDGYFTDRPQFTGSGSISSAIQHSKSPADGYFNTSLFRNFTCPASVNFGLFCDSPLGRNTLIGPGFVNFDTSLAKRFRITERFSLQLQANFFDVFNHPNFQNPVGSLISGHFGQSLSTYGDLGGHRITQLAVRIDF